MDVALGHLRCWGVDALEDLDSSKLNNSVVLQQQ